MKKFSRVFTGFLTFVLVCTLTVPFLIGAAPVSAPKHKIKYFFDKDMLENLSDEQKKQIEAKQAEIHSLLESSLTEEQKATIDARKADIEAQRADLAEKWKALSDSQKEELYGLYDNIINAHTTTVDKYLELGLIGGAAAQDMKEKLLEKKNSMREQNITSMFAPSYFKMCIEDDDD